MEWDSKFYLISLSNNNNNNNNNGNKQTKKSAWFLESVSAILSEEKDSYCRDPTLTTARIICILLVLNQNYLRVHRLVGIFFVLWFIRFLCPLGVLG